MLKTTVDGSCKHFYLSITPVMVKDFTSCKISTDSQLGDVIDIVIQENSFQFGF